MRAAALGSLRATLNLIKCLSRGIGMKKDFKRCAELLLSLNGKAINSAENIPDNERLYIHNCIIELCIRFHLLSLEEKEKGNSELEHLYWQVANAYKAPSLLVSMVEKIKAGDIIFVDIFLAARNYVTFPLIYALKAYFANYTYYAIKETFKDAEAGKTAEICELGILYFFYVVGKDEGSKRESKAFELFKKAADRGYNSAYYWMALCYELGFGVEQNLKKAASLYTYVLQNNRIEQDYGPFVEKSAKDGHESYVILTDSAYRLAMIYLNSEDTRHISFQILFNLMSNEGHHFSALALCKFAVNNNFEIPGSNFNKEVVVTNLKILVQNGVGEASAILGDIYSIDDKSEEACNSYLMAFMQGRVEVYEKLKKFNLGDKLLP
jgi:TPR repeat protein